MGDGGRKGNPLGVVVSLHVRDGSSVFSHMEVYQVMNF